MRREIINVQDQVFPGSLPEFGDEYMHGRRIKLYRLVNNGYFFLRYVFILAEDDDYRLVVIHDNKLLTDRHYKSLSIAKSAFARMYNRKAWKKGVKPEWGSFFPPGAGWIKDKIEGSLKDPSYNEADTYEAVQ